MLIENFRNTLDIWIKELNNYDFTSLQTKPSTASWSLGQLYIHLIEETNYYIKQINICLTSNKNKVNQSTTEAKTMFSNNCFPDERIEGAPQHRFIQQPANKEQLARDLVHLKDVIDTIELLMSKSIFKGKTKHPGLGYFNASEWLQFAEMHLRHHLRQKKRIDDFLKINR